MASRWISRLALGLICLVLVQQASALDVQYCSDLNTASTSQNISIYQSNGLCSDFCRPSYAFAVVQDKGCWCSNYAPGTTTDGCNSPCPGFPEESCGGNGLYGYLALSILPSGTKGGNSGAKTTTTKTTQATTPSAVDPVTIFVTPTVSSSSSATKTTPTSTTKTTTTDSTSSTWTPSPIISLITVTDGQVYTTTVTPTVPPNAGTVSGVKTTSNGGGGGLGTGGAVGLTVGLVALVAIISSIVFFCIRKRRQEKSDEYNDVSRRGSSAGMAGPIPSRTMSENSRYVLGTDGRQVVETWEPGDHQGVRSSRLMPVDPRLDPFAPVYQRENKSRESVNTIRDDHDYSRRVAMKGPILRATNPDAPDTD